jgi:hypothetical protein
MVGCTKPGSMTIFSVIHEGWQVPLGPKVHPSSDQG